MSNGQGKDKSYEIGSGERSIGMMPDPSQVHSPTHYNKKGIEAIQAIEASMSDEEFQGYLKGNTLKYLWRYRYKENPAQDLDKALWYLNKLRDSI